MLLSPSPVDYAGQGFGSHLCFSLNQIIAFYIQGGGLLSSFVGLQGTGRGGRADRKCGMAEDAAGKGFGVAQGRKCGIGKRGEVS